jgi:hypothetical protein
MTQIPDGRIIWSLWDVLERFGPTQISGALLNLHGDMLAITAFLETDNKIFLSEEPAIAMRRHVVILREACQKAQLANGVVMQAIRLERRLKEFRPDDQRIAAAVVGQLEDLIASVMTELSHNVYLGVPEKNLYMHPELEWGELVKDAFPDAVADMYASTRCLALDEPDACVFHSMGVLEHALKWLCARVNIEYSEKNWQTIIVQVESILNKEQRKDARPVDLDFYKDLATHFRYIKDAWRNHVIHRRVAYDNVGAKRIWNNVRQLAIQIAEFEHTQKA